MAQTALSQIPREIAEKLTFKQREFIRLCVARGAGSADGVVAKCYLDAGFKVTFASAKVCGNNVLNSLAGKKYRQALELLRDEAALERMKTEWHRSLEERQALAHYDIGDLFDEEGKLLPIYDMPESARRAVSGIHFTRGKITSVKMANKAPHLNVIEERYSIMPENRRIPQKIEHSGEVTVVGMTRAEIRQGIDHLFARWEKMQGSAAERPGNGVAEHGDAALLVASNGVAGGSSG